MASAWESIIDLAISGLDNVLPTPGMRRNLVRVALGEIRKGISPMPAGVRILDAFKSRGMGIRSQDFYSYYRNAKDISVKMVEQIGSDWNARIDVDSIMAGVPGQSTQYQYKFMVWVEDYDTSQWDWKHFSVGTDAVLTPYDAFQLFKARFGDSIAEHGADLDKVSFEGMFERPDEL